MHSQDVNTKGVGGGGGGGSIFSFEVAITFMNFEFPIFFLHTIFSPKAGKWCFLIQRK